MAYSVRYGSDPEVKEHGKLKKWRKWLISLCALLLGAFAWRMFPEAADTVRTAFFPWTEMAAESFSESLEAGNGVGDAFTAFCRQMLSEAGD